MRTLDGLLASHPLPTWRTPGWLAIAFVTAGILWASFSSIEEVAVAPGEVVPQTKVKVVQHLEGGIIQEIAVSEGTHVRSGDLLLRLDLATSGVNRNELTARLDGEHLRRSRLMAETQGGPLALAPDPARRQPELAEAERRAFDVRRRELVSTLGVLKEQMNQRENEVQELEARRRSVAANLALARERLKMSASLLSEGLTARMEHLELQAEVEKLEGEVRTLAPAGPRTRAAVAEAEQRLKEAGERFRREAQEQLGQVEQSIARLRELLAEATDQGLRADIRSPIEGVVKKLRYHTIGGVVSPGEPIMEIVPTEDNLVIQARVSPTDRGYVDAGQPARVKITTYDFVRYGALTGHVDQVAPDSVMDSNGTTYFDVVIVTDKGYLGTEQQPLPISPGMQATVDINTGRRTVLQFLMKPVLKLRDEAMRER